METEVVNNTPVETSTVVNNDVIVVGVGIGLTLKNLEKEFILKTLAHYQNNKSKTAESLGITIKTLYNKLNLYGVVKSKVKGVENAV